MIILQEEQTQTHRLSYGNLLQMKQLDILNVFPDLGTSPIQLIT